MKFKDNKKTINKSMLKMDLQVIYIKIQQIKTINNSKLSNKTNKRK